MTGPRWPVAVAVFLASVLLFSILAASVRTPEPASTLIEPCALVLDRNGQQRCR